MEKLEFNVSGMDCGGCETSIVNALKRVPGVADATANHRNGEVLVTPGAPAPDVDALVGAIEDAGYEVVARPI